ncbi:Ig-like domain-containing protein [Candidatus Binatia bacterium]|nr:Ig-like domain-containing protein [Candidatus Binatia bacterium]
MTGRTVGIGFTWAILLLATVIHPAAAATLQSITLSPQNISLEAGRTQVYTATGRYDDGSTANVTQQATWTVSNAGVAIVVDFQPYKGLVTTVAAGTTRVTASITVASGTIRGSSTLTVTEGDLVSITTKPTTKNLEVGQQSQFKATALYVDESTDDVTKDVTWSSTDPSVASVSNDSATKGLVSAHKVGTATIYALDEASGVSNSDGATTVRAQVSNLSFDPPKVVMGKGMTYPLRVYANRVDGTRSQITDEVEFSVVPSGVVQIGTGAQAGVLTPLANGDATISAFDPKRKLSTSTSGTDGRVAVRGRLVGLEVQPDPLRVTVGELKNARAIGLLNTGKETSDLRRIVQWSVVDSTVASVGNTAADVGEVKGKKSGKTTLRASYAGFQSAETDNLVVLGNLQAVDLEIGDGLVPLNEEMELKARGTYEGGIELNISDRCTWAVTNTLIAEVDNVAAEIDGDGKGFVKGKKTGQTTVSVNCDGKRSSKQISVIGTLTRIEMDPTAYDATALEDKKFHLWGQYTGGAQKDLTKLSEWSSSNTQVALVDNVLDKGNVTAVATGSATITAKYKTLQASGQLSVGAGLVSMFVVPNAKTVRGSDYVKLRAKGKNANDEIIDVTKRVVWATTNAQIVRVSNREGEQGLAFGGGKEGAAQIVASLPGTSFVARADITTSCLLTKLKLVRDATPIPAGEARRIKARGTFCDGSTRVISQSVVFSSSNPAVLQVSNDPKAWGVLTAVAPGTATISAVDVSSGRVAENPTQITVVAP